MRAGVKMPELPDIKLPDKNDLKSGVIPPAVVPPPIPAGIPTVPIPPDIKLPPGVPFPPLPPAPPPSKSETGIIPVVEPVEDIRQSWTSSNRPEPPLVPTMSSSYVPQYSRGSSERGPPLTGSNLQPLPNKLLPIRGELRSPFSDPLGEPGYHPEPTFRPPPQDMINPVLGPPNSRYDCPQDGPSIRPIVPTRFPDSVLSNRFRPPVADLPPSRFPPPERPVFGGFGHEQRGDPRFDGPMFDGPHSRHPIDHDRRGPPLFEVRGPLNGPPGRPSFGHNMPIRPPFRPDAPRPFFNADVRPPFNPDLQRPPFEPDHSHHRFDHKDHPMHHGSMDDRSPPPPHHRGGRPFHHGDEEPYCDDYEIDRPRGGDRRHDRGGQDLHNERPDFGPPRHHRGDRFHHNKNNRGNKFNRHNNDRHQGPYDDDRRDSRFRPSKHGHDDFRDREDSRYDKHDGPSRAKQKRKSRYGRGDHHGGGGGDLEDGEVL